MGLVCAGHGKVHRQVGLSKRQPLAFQEAGGSIMAI